MELLQSHPLPERIRNISPSHHHLTRGRVSQVLGPQHQQQAAGVLLKTRPNRHLPQRPGWVIMDRFRADGNLHPGDPGMMFFEFQLLVMRLAWDCYPRDM